MVNWATLSAGIAAIIVGVAFLFGSLNLVDENNNFIVGGFGLFIGGLFGMALGIFVIYRGFSD